ncbi:isochorismate synthase [Aliifodinibius salipaludis]|uniref:isochorismate synthase n=1 Tax=Fodinibius salipaludis TaxID=2032627 RepID=A0A2A2GFZ3_9BACT|nr:isochorismate synthase [Aliifodinibius salipaludis]PAU95692.1 isochorismate synthase [Aliifodinibius salipaludis]
MNDNPLSDLKDHLPSSVTRFNKSEYNDFLDNLFKSSTARYATFSFPIHSIDPLAYLEMCWKEDDFQYYWEKPNDEFAIAAGGEITSVTASGPNRFNGINNKVSTLGQQTAEFSTISHPYSGMFLLGGFSFFDQNNDDLWEDFPPASFYLPRWMIIKDGKFTLATFSIDVNAFSAAHELNNYITDQLDQLNATLEQKKSDGNTHQNGEASPTLLPKQESDYQKWTDSVIKAKELIRKNTFEKIVLARSIKVPKSTAIPPTQVVNSLRKQYTNCYNFLIHKPSGNTFLGSTPERLMSARNKLLLTEALAGSIGRGNTATEDAFLENKLSGNGKDQNEHNFVVQDIEERLEPFVKELSRNTTPEVKKLSNVQHLYTPIRAQLNEKSTILEVLGQLHPTPAVGGYPWEKAAPFIKDLEHFERGRYAGPIGWINSKGNMEFAVAIRSALCTKNHAHLFAGCGIVKDSDPATEWEETNLKLKPMLSALQYD